MRRVRVQTGWSCFEGREGIVLRKLDDRIMVILEGEEMPLSFEESALVAIDDEAEE